MKATNNKQVPALKLNEGILKGGYKPLTNLQKMKVKAGWNNSKCRNRLWCRK